MAPVATRTKSTAIPCLRYADAPAAIEWLCEAFGFEKQLVVPHPDGTIAHSQLRLNGGLIMVSSAVDSEFGRLMKRPEEIGGASTHVVCLIVPDADLVYAQAKAAGAVIVFDIKDEDYGGRSFTCRDPEGYLWCIGTYDPWDTGVERD